MTRKVMIAFLMVFALIAVGVISVMAQEGDDETPPYGAGMMHNRHGSMMWGGQQGFGMMWDDQQPMIDVAAEVLGLEPDAFIDAIHNGQTLSEIAAAQGVELQSVYDALLANAETHMAAMVEAGHITQAYADEHLTWMRDNIESMPMFSGNGNGPCMDNDEAYGMGMMGQHRGMRHNHS